jgi:hypothetical protein
MTQLLSQAAAEAILGPHKTTLAECLREGVNRFNGERAAAGPVSTRSRANLIHDFATESAERDFAGVAGIAFAEDHGFPVILFDGGKIEDCPIDGTLIVRFKKLTERLAVCNNDTVQTHKWNGQEEIEGMPPATKVVAGYILDELGEVERLMLVCSKYGRVLWAMDLDDNAGALVLPIGPVDPSLVDGAVVRSARKAEESDSADAGA